MMRVKTGTVMGRNMQDKVNQ